MEWYQLEDALRVDTPALLLYPDRVLGNIRLALKIVGSASRLRPHVKTNKIAEVCGMMRQEGIDRFKCATIAEAEMLGNIHAADVLIAYQPVGPKVGRVIELIHRFPSTEFSFLVDDIQSLQFINHTFGKQGMTARVFVDLNVGMDRTGVRLPRLPQLVDAIASSAHVRLVGIHAYDGHITDVDPATRKKRVDAVYEQIVQARSLVDADGLVVVAGGSPVFPFYAAHADVECSPGTFVFWDWSYERYAEQPFQFAALVMTRVVSVGEGKLTLDLGHKSVAAENPQPRVLFLNAPELVPVSQSEEHLVVSGPDVSAFVVGDILYGVPLHVCPTVALYERALTVSNNRISGEWRVVARDRRITI